MTPKEALCMISHKFHGKGPGKTEAIPGRYEVEANEKFRYTIPLCGAEEGGSSSVKDNPTLFSAVMLNQGKIFVSNLYLKYKVLLIKA